MKKEGFLAIAKAAAEKVYLVSPLQEKITIDTNEIVSADTDPNATIGRCLSDDIACENKRKNKSLLNR